MANPDSRRRKTSFLEQIFALLRMARGNPLRSEFMQRALGLIAEWADCDVILFKADGDSGFSFSTGLARAGDRFNPFSTGPGSREGDIAHSPGHGGKDVLQAIRASLSHGKRHGFLTPRGTFWTRKSGPFLARHGNLLMSAFPCFHPHAPGTARAQGPALDVSASLPSATTAQTESSGDIWVAREFHGINERMSVALLCSDISDSSSLCLLTAWRDPGLVNKTVIDLLECGLDALSGAYEHWWLAWSLEERLKELTCLHAIVNLISNTDITLGAFLGKAVEIIPEAWLHREVAAARITLDGKEYASPGFSEGEQKLSADISIGGQRRGHIEVNYAVKMPSMDEGPFLKEERKLLDAIAGELSLQIERKFHQEEKRRVTEQLRHSNRLLVIGQLAAAVAHELNEPLTSILGFSQLAAKSPHLPEQVAKDLERIVAISLHAREVVRKLLMYGGKMPERRSLVSINATVRDVLNLFGHRLLRDGIALKLDLSEQDPAIIADPGQMRQVVANLVLNAVQAMSQGGTLTIATDAGRGDVSLVVEDTGCGMGPEIKEKIFIPFFTTKSASQGTGLGLSVVHEIIAGLHGSIQVETLPGRGSCFTVRFPLPEASPPPDGKRKKRE